MTLGVFALLIALRGGPLLPPWRVSRVVVWALASLLLYAFSFVFVSDAGPESLQAFISTSEPLLLLIAFILLLQDRAALRAAAYTMVLVVIAGVLLNYVDFFARHLVPTQMSLVPGRAAGLYLDANVAGYTLAFGTLTSAWILPRRLRFAYCLFAATGVFLTFSRSSIMLMALVIVAMSWYQWFAAPRRWSVALSVAAIVIAGWALAGGQWASGLQQAGLGRYLDENTATRISGSFVGQHDESTADRLRVARRGIAAFLDAPLVGHGIGALNTRDLFTEPHNQYIVVAAEMGIIGLAMFLTSLVLIFRSGSDLGRMMAAAYAFGCMFLHFIPISPGIEVMLALTVAYGNVRAMPEDASVPPERTSPATSFRPSAARTAV